MMLRILPKSAWAVSICALFAIVVSLTCSRRSVDSPDRVELGVAIDLSLASPALLEQAETYRYEVWQGDDLIDSGPLHREGDLLTGTIDSLPANVQLVFVAQILAADGELIYEGRYTATLEPGKQASVPIILSPQMPLIGLYPRWIDLGEEETEFEIAVKAYQLEPMVQMAFEVTWQAGMLRSNGAEIDPSLQIATLSDSPEGSSWLVQITSNNQSVPLVDDTGHAALATLSFKRDSGATDSGVIALSVRVVSIDDGSPTMIIHGDGCSVNMEAADIPFLSLSASEWSAAAPAETTTIDVANIGNEESIAFIVNEQCDWCWVDVTDGTTPGQFTLAVDANNSETSRSCAVTVTANHTTEVFNSPETLIVNQASDNTAPSVPQNLQCAVVPGENQIDLSWDPSSDDIAVVGYKVYRNGSFLKQVDSTSTSDADLSCGTSYCYRVIAVDDALNESAGSNTACCETESCPELCVTPTSWTAQPCSDQSDWIGVTNCGGGSELDITVTVDCDWITLVGPIYSTPGGFAIRADSNLTGVARECTITITAYGEVAGSPQYVTVSQDTCQSARLCVTPLAWTAPRCGGISEWISVINCGSGKEFDVSVTENCSWITLEDQDNLTPGGFVIRADSNRTGIARECTITITAGDEVAGSPQYVTVSQNSCVFPELCVEPDSVWISAFGGSSEPVCIWNCGTGQIGDYILDVNNCPWVWFDLAYEFECPDLGLIFRGQPNTSGSIRTCAVTVDAGDIPGSPAQVQVTQSGLMPNFIEDFEYYEPGSIPDGEIWSYSIIKPSNVMVDDVGNPGNSVLFTDPTGDDTDTSGAQIGTDFGTNIYGCTFDVRIRGTSNYWGIRAWDLPPNDWDSLAFQIAVYGTDLWAVGDNELVLLRSLNPLSWYHVRVEMNWILRNYDVYVDGKLAANDVPFYGQNAAGSWLQLVEFDLHRSQLDGPTDGVWVDNIRVYYPRLLQRVGPATSGSDSPAGSLDQGASGPVTGKDR